MKDDIEEFWEVAWDLVEWEYGRSIGAPIAEEQVFAGLRKLLDVASTIASENDGVRLNFDQMERILKKGELK